MVVVAVVVIITVAVIAVVMTLRITVVMIVMIAVIAVDVAALVPVLLALLASPPLAAARDAVKVAAETWGIWVEDVRHVACDKATRPAKLRQ